MNASDSLTISCMKNSKISLKNLFGRGKWLDCRNRRGLKSPAEMRKSAQADSRPPSLVYTALCLSRTIHRPGKAQIMKELGY